VRRYDLAVRKSPRAPVAVLVLVVVGWVAINIVWVLRFRWGYPTEWDESGYLAIGVRDVAALTDHGLVSFARVVETQAVQAPLVPAAASLAFAVFGAGMGQGVVVVCAFGALLIVGTFAVGREIMDGWWALLAATVVASIPLVTDYSRIFHFAVPAAAFFVAAILTLMRSDQLGRRPMAVACGVLLGLMVLSRSMTIAYVPAVGLAAVLQVAVAKRDRARRLVSAGLGALAGAFVASLWYLRNWRSVLDYLGSTGYGSGSVHYGSSRSPLSGAYWTRVAREVATDLYLPLALVVVLCLVIGARHVAKRNGEPVRERLLTVSSSRWFVLVVVVAEGYAAMSSSKNNGTAFALPWLPALILLAVAAASRVRWNTGRRVLAALLVVTAVGDIAMKSGFVSPLAGSASTQIPGLGNVTVLEGRGILQASVIEGSGFARRSATSPPPAFHKRWTGLEKEVVRAVEVCAAPTGTVAPTGFVATSGQILSNTSFDLAAALANSEARFEWLKPYTDTVNAYRAVLEPAPVHFLVTATTSAAASRRTRARAEQAARISGYRTVSSFAMPDGRLLRLWWRHPAHLGPCRIAR
jgi:4-amino-4-deoxy-L-arabinose transferase-like glycosyltransferase